MNAKDSLGDRMKANYEDRYRFCLPRRVPAIIRLDGKAFHTFTRGFMRPYSHELRSAMINAAAELAQEVQGCKAAYLQSDEVSLLLTDYDQIQTAAWFDYNVAKMVSVAASCMTAAFNRTMRVGGVEVGDAMFDARAFSIPREEVSNYFLWRAKDWERNSLSMYCQAFFSHKQLHGKGRAEQHEMLHGIGKNWATDTGEMWRNGTWLIRGTSDEGWRETTSILPNFAAIDAVLSPMVNPDSPPRATEGSAKSSATDGAGSPSER